jgi:hypothetical protein
MTSSLKRLIVLAPACLALCLACAQGASGDRTRPPKQTMIRSTVPCTLSVEPGLVIEVRDAKTGQPAACGAQATIRDGAYVETVADSCTGEGLRLRGAFERSGTYDVQITKPGYKDWTRDAVVVRRGDDCHVGGVWVEADLEQQ